MERLAVDMHGAGAAITGVAALLDAEHIEIAQERAQALAGRRLGRIAAAIDVDNGSSELRADLFGKILGDVALVRSRSVHVVEIGVRRQSGVQRMAQFASRRAGWRSATAPAAAWPPRRSAGNPRHRRPTVAMMSAAERPSLVSDTCRIAARLDRAAAGRWILRSSSPFRSTLWWLPVTKSTTDTSRGSPPRGHSVQTPSSAAVSEIIAPAGSDMQTLPPTVAAFQILNDIRNASMHCRNSGTARHPSGPSKSCSSTIRQVAAMSRPGFRHRQRRPAEAVEIDQRVDGHLRLGEQPGSTRQPRIAIAPAVDVVDGCRALDLRDRGQDS